MTNQALPPTSQRLLDHYLAQCQNLGLILDKYAPWGLDRHGNWELVMRHTIRRRGQNQLVTSSGGEAKGLWLSTTRQHRDQETPSLFEAERVDVELMQAEQARWIDSIKDAEGLAFSLRTATRLAVGLGATHVLETGLTLDRNTGLPYIPGSTVKGLARAWGLIEVASQLGITLDEFVQLRNVEIPLLNMLAEILISPDDDKIRSAIEVFKPVSDDAHLFIQVFRWIFGSQSNAGGLAFTDNLYFGRKAPSYATDVMTPHYINYYSENGVQPPTESDSPNPVSFITVDRGNVFTFGLILRRAALQGTLPIGVNELFDVARDWLVSGLTQLGAGSKTAAGYGFFNRQSYRQLWPQEEIQ